MAVYDFKEQYEKQEAYFDQFVEWVKSRSNVIGVTIADETDEKRGIDLWAVMKNEDPVPMQVKVDFIMHNTGNMAVEAVSQARFDGPWKPGWLSHLHSTRLLAYICAQTGEFRIYRSQDFWWHVMSHCSQYQSFSALNGSKDGGDYWYSIGLRVPVCTMTTGVWNYGNIGDLVTGEAELRVA